MINALVRLVHRGSGGQDGALIRACGAVTDHFDAQDSRSKTTKANKRYQDEWRLDGRVLIRVHNVPRTSKFVPSECDDCPVDIDLLTDDRTTELFFRNGKTKEHDMCRFRGNSTGGSVKNGSEQPSSVSSLKTWKGQLAKSSQVLNKAKTSPCVHKRGD